MHQLRRPSVAASPSRAPGASGGRVSAILVPVGAKPALPQQPSTTASEPPGPPQRSLRGALTSLFRGWDSRAPAETVQALVEETTVAARQADALDEERSSAAAKSAGAGPLPDISACLRPVGVMEARYVRVLSSLCALTYHLDNLTPSSLLRRHRLRLITTSKVCDARLREPRRSAADIVAEGDAMAGDPAIVSAAQAEIAASEARALAQPSPALAAVKRVSPLATVDAAAGGSALASGSADAGDGLSPVDRVAASLAAAAAAASAAASSAAQGVYTAAVPYAGPLANNIIALGTLPPVRSMAAQLQSAAAVGHSSAVATVTTVAAALESTWSGQSSRLPKECQSPTEWFIADDLASHTRYFVIQGSDNLDHWRVNLTFDPVPFEDPALGIKVHRGVYETAVLLYDRFLPLVQDHLATSPFAKVAFTGHSLGGSLGTVLMLMYVRRGVLPKSAISPVYTFGAPAIFCEGGAGGGSACVCGAGADAGTDAASPAAAQPQICAPSGVLGLLGLPDAAVRNVLMHKDIVPRAFACDYTLVADLLKRVSDSFREHRCLNGQRTVMFDFIGKMMVLQPDAAASFVGGEGHHPLLPPTAGLFLLREPAPLSSVAATLKNDASFMQQAMAQAISNLPAPAAAAAPASPAPLARAQTTPAKQEDQQELQMGSPVGSAREALWVLMNRPHPLDILADPGAYGDAGAISRYHNPDNYTRALGGVLRARGAAWRRLATRAGEAGMRYFAPVLDPSQLRAAATAAADTAGGSAAAPHAAATADRRATSGGKQSLLTRLSPPRGGLPHSSSSGQLA